MKVIKAFIKIIKVLLGATAGTLLTIALTALLQSIGDIEAAGNQILLMGISALFSAIIIELTNKKPKKNKSPN